MSMWWQFSSTHPIAHRRRLNLRLVILKMLSSFLGVFFVRKSKYGGFFMWAFTRVFFFGEKIIVRGGVSWDFSRVFICGEFIVRVLFLCGLS